MTEEEILNLPSNPWDEEAMFVNTKEFLEHLMEYGEVLGTIPFYDFGTRELRLTDMIGYTDIRHENTDNDWQSLLSHALECMVCGNTESGYVVALAPHRSGDIRTNYNDYIVFRFKDIYQLQDAVSDFCSKMEFAVDVFEEDDYFVQYRNSLDGWCVYNRHYDWICDIESADDWDDLKKQIREQVEKTK